MPSLFDSLGEAIPRTDWKPVAPPSLDGIREVYLNFETTGLRWFDGDKPLSLSLATPDGRTWYLPWGHNGGNLDEATIKRWAERELRGKHIVNINTRFDIHMGREWGIDFETQGNTVSDVGHYAALLDDHRRHLSLDSLIPDYLQETPMNRLDESRMRDYHAADAAARSQYNVDCIRRLKQVMWPLLDEQDLQQVRALEDRVIYVVCEMEKNGALLDLELLDKWIKLSQKQLEAYLWQLVKEVGFQVNPDSPKDQQRVFEKFKISLEFTSKGAPSFTDEILKRIEHPTIQLMRRAGKLISLRNKFIVNSKKNIDSKGILRYALHQLRATKDEFSEAGEAGTVTGRFSSSEIVRGFGINIQQRMKAAKQRLAFGYGEKDSSHDDEIFVVRKLHIAASGQVLTTDMDQAQYRIFASYVNNPKVIQAYRDNPHLSFHEFMWDSIKPYADLSYRQQKDLNFAVIFGAGLTKMAWMLGHITKAEFDEIRRTKAYNSPLLAKTKEVKKIYDREIPEVKDLLEEASHLGKPQCDDKCHRGDSLHQRLPHRGYVKTVAGRRMRFPDGQRLHKAFNGVDQGTEADVMKQKLVEIHEARKETGFLLRITNHDELVGDIPDLEHAKMVNEIVNRQSFPQLRVPLTWSTGIGPNWAECKDV